MTHPILDSIDTELVIARERVEQLQELRDRAFAVVTSLPDVAKPEGGGVPDPRPKAATKSAKAKLRPKAASGLSNKERGKQLRDQILAHLRETGGSQVNDVAEALSLDPSRVRVQLNGLASRGAIRVERLGHGGKTSPRLYRPAETPMAPTDSNGAKTGPERKIVEAVESLQLTTSEIAAGTQIPEHQVREIVNGLCRRGVLEREDFGGRPVFGLADGAPA